MEELLYLYGRITALVCRKSMYVGLQHMYNNPIHMTISGLLHTTVPTVTASGYLTHKSYGVFVSNTNYKGIRCLLLLTEIIDKYFN